MIVSIMLMTNSTSAGRGVRICQGQDVVDDPEWKFAPVGVVSRHERDVVNMAQAEAFARSFDTPLVRWQLPLTEPLGDESLERALYLEEPGLWGTHSKKTCYVT